VFTTGVDARNGAKDTALIPFIGAFRLINLDFVRLIIKVLLRKC
jgi:hypothetical protein